MLIKRYFSFYDGEGTDGGENPPAPPAPKTYTEAEYKIAIENERKRESDRIRTLNTQLEDLKKKAGEKSELEKTIKELQDSLLTKEELAKKQLEEKEKLAATQLETLTKEKETWQNRFQNTLIQRELVDAASKEGAYDPNIFISLLRDRVNTVEEKDPEGNPTGQYKVNVKIDATDKNNKSIILTLSPEEAIKHLKSQPEKFGYLFKGVGTPGTGSNNESKTFEKMDLESMDLETYKKYREKIKG